MPGKVLDVDASRRIGRVDVLGTARRVNLIMLDDVAPGDWVLIELGLATEKIDEGRAQEINRLLEELGQAFAGDDVEDRSGDPAA